MFVLPDELPTTVAELNALLDQAQRHINVTRARHEAGEEMTAEDAADLRGLFAAVDTINEAIAGVEAAEAETVAANEAVATEINELLARTNTAGTEAETEAPAEGESAGADAPEAPAEGEQTAVAAGGASTDGGSRAVSFAGVSESQTPPRDEGPGWIMRPDSPGFVAGRVGFATIATALDTVRPGSRAAVRPTGTKGDFNTQVIASLGREVEVVDTPHALVAAITKATDQSQLPGGSLVAAAANGGGWCSPSEQLYDFCDVPDAVDLVSLPEITIKRGGVRWPNEPDYSAMYDQIGFHYTEAELIAGVYRTPTGELADGPGDDDENTLQNPPVKDCVSIPCPDEFTEIRLEALGFCVEAGILQAQGWPELIENFMRHAVNAHLRKVSKATLGRMIDGSTSVDLTASGASKYVSASTSVLNGLVLQAVNLRLNKGLGRTATIEGVAPSWLHEVFRADLAQQEGLAVKDVSDAQITGWLSARNIVLQYVGDWQTRGAGQPGNMATVAWPSTVNIMLYPAGTWFRAMSPIIEFGVMYPRDLLQVNRYSHIFTEDAFAVAKRCDKSINVKVSLDLTGGIGQRYPLPTP